MLRRLVTPIITAVLLAGCSSAPLATEVGPGTSSAIELVNLWRVTGAEGETADTWLRIDKSEFQLWRECEMISGSWRATEGLMIASVFSASGSCASDGIPSVHWIDAITGYQATNGGWQLVDATGSPIASLTIDGAPEPIDTAAEFYAEPPEVTDETRQFFDEAVALPASLAVGALEGQWAAEGVDTSTGAGVEFAADGTWTGSDGCNGGSGRWTTDLAGSFLATSGASTLMACDGAFVPSWVSTALLAGFDGDVLVLLDSGGAELGRLVRA